LLSASFQIDVLPEAAIIPELIVKCCKNQDDVDQVSRSIATDALAQLEGYQQIKEISDLRQAASGKTSIWKLADNKTHYKHVTH
jgi:hypothetical protein